MWWDQDFEFLLKYSVVFNLPPPPRPPSSSKNRHVCANRHLSHLALHTLILLPCSAVVLSQETAAVRETHILRMTDASTHHSREKGDSGPVFTYYLCTYLLDFYQWSQYDAPLIAMCFLMRKRLTNNVHFLKLSVWGDNFFNKLLKQYYVPFHKVSCLGF